MKNILVVFGTRPEVIKLAPVIIELRKHPQDYNVIVCNTEQQKELSNQTLEYFDLKADINLDCMRENQTALKIALMVLLLLGVNLLFTPYMVFLWYKKATDRRFIFRIFLNSILILAGTGVAVYFYLFKLSLGVSNTILLGIATFGGCLVLDIIIYSIFRKGHFVQWIKEMFFSIFVNNIVGIVAGSIITLLIFLIVPLFVPLNLKTLLIVGIASVELFWVIYLLIPSKNKNTMLDDFNEEGLLALKRLALEDRR